MSKPLHLHDGTGVVYRDSAGYVLESHGTTVPTDGVTGHHHGATFKHTDGTTDADALYVNVGSLSSANYDPITDVSLSSDLASVADGKGASLIGIEDDGSFTAQVNVEEALQELYQHLFSATGGTVQLPITAWREVDANGDVGNAAANGGVLASDTTPVLEADAAEAMCVTWAATNVDPVAIGVALPDDFDRAADCVLSIRVKAAGSTNAPSFTVETSCDGAAKVTDTATGSASATIQTINATIAAADVPDTAVAMTIGLTPGTHGTDAWSVYSVQLKYKRKLLTA